jgi:hypothetical protein
MKLLCPSIGHIKLGYTEWPHVRHVTFILRFVRLDITPHKMFAHASIWKRRKVEKKPNETKLNVEKKGRNTNKETQEQTN